MMHWYVAEVGGVVRMTSRAHPDLPSAMTEMFGRMEEGLVFRSAHKVSALQAASAGPGRAWFKLFQRGGEWCWTPNTRR